jgi:hypothetical protein
VLVLLLYGMQDPAFFKLISEAYNVLSVAHKRKKYDESEESKTEKARRRNAKWAFGAGGAYSKRVREAEFAAGGSRATVAFDDSIATQLAYMKANASVRGATGRLDRHEVSIPSHQESYGALFYAPLLIATLVGVVVMSAWEAGVSDAVSVTHLTSQELDALLPTAKEAAATHVANSAPSGASSLWTEHHLGGKPSAER